MDIRVLKYFVTVVEEENILKASQVLHITQPTLSRQLMDLEKELNYDIKWLNKLKNAKNDLFYIFKKKNLLFNILLKIVI